MEFGTVILISCYALLLFAPIVKSSLPGPVVECSDGFTNCTVSNSYGMFPDRSTCKAAQAVYPATEKQLLASVAEAVQKNQKMRVVTRYSHSIPKLVCPGGESGLIISTLHLDRIVSVDKSGMRMTFESGVTLKDLIDGAAKEGLALPHSPYWLGVTLGGMLGTGSHGSSLFGNGSAVHEFVVGMRLVVPASQNEGYAKVVSLTEADEDLNALKVSLGVLGVISEVTLQLQPMFKRSITNDQQNDTDLERRITQFGLEHEFADVTWYPAQRRVLYRVDDRVPVNTSGDGVNNFLGFRPASHHLIAFTRMLEEEAESYHSIHVKCAFSSIQVRSMIKLATGLQNNDCQFVDYPVIGYQNNMQAAGSCLSSPEDGLHTACAWDPRIKGGLLFFENGISISVSKIGQFLSDVRKLTNMFPNSLCGVELYYGFLMRYVKASSAYLGKQEDSVAIEMTYYRAHDPNTPRLYEDVLEEIEQMALIKYGGLPHWGKNRNIAFDGVMKKYSKYEVFLAAKTKYDPKGLFSNEWTDGILGIGEAGVIIKRDGCALEGLCVCSEDAHCAPDKGYFCKPGRVYREARVCSHTESPPGWIMETIVWPLLSKIVHTSIVLAVSVWLYRRCLRSRHD